jgi:hypothetical protein
MSQISDEIALLVKVQTDQIAKVPTALQTKLQSESFSSSLICLLSALESFAASDTQILQ